MIAHRTLASSSPTRHTLVLLHAFPMSSRMWDAVAAALQGMRDDVEVILVDLPGFDDARVTEAWTMEDAARSIFELLQSTQRRSVVLGGLSMGGYVALKFYREYGSMLSGLILSDTKAEADTEAQKRVRSQFAKDTLERGPQAAVDRLYGGFVTEKTGPDIAVQIQQWIMAADARAVAAALIAMRDRQDSTDLLAMIKVPTAVIVGEHDEACTPAQMRGMAMNIANSSFEVIPEAAHLSAVEKPTEWAEIVSSFLDRLAV